MLELTSIVQKRTNHPEKEPKRLVSRSPLSQISQFQASSPNLSLFSLNNSENCDPNEKSNITKDFYKVHLISEDQAPFSQPDLSPQPLRPTRYSSMAYFDNVEAEIEKRMNKRARINHN